MIHSIVYLAFIGLVGVVYIAKPRWTYISLIPLIILFGVVGAQVPFRNTIEGLFGYIPEMLTVALGAVFIYVLKSTGSLENLASAWARFCGKNTFFSLLGIMVIGLVPGMATGSALFSFAVLSALLLPLLKEMGISDAKGSAFLLTAAVLGMMAPPANIPLMIMNGSNWGSITGVYPFMWLIVWPGVLVSVVYFSLVCRTEFSGGEGLPGRKLLPADFYGIGIVLGLLLLRGIFPKSALGGVGLPLIFFIGTVFHWLLHKEKNGGFFSVSQKAVTDSVQLLLLFVGCSLVLHVSMYAGTQNVAVGMAKGLSIGYSIVFLVAAGLLFGAVWEGLGALVVIPVYFINTLMAYYSAVVASSAILTAFAACLVCLGVLLPIGWKRSVIESGPFEKGMERLVLVPALLLLIWLLFVYWKVGLWFSQLLIS
ncbi:MAG: hypothetical protein GY866_33585 [Proteobacteria bacterium]|nr:hypothetical protein [Pseudomonadota bacterium]